MYFKFANQFLGRLCQLNCRLIRWMIKSVAPMPQAGSITETNMDELMFWDDLFLINVKCNVIKYF